MMVRPYTYIDRILLLLLITGRTAELADMSKGPVQYVERIATNYNNQLITTITNNNYRIDIIMGC